MAAGVMLPVMNLTLIGRTGFGVALAGSGLMQLVNRDFVRLVPKLPAWVPVPGLWPVVTGALLLVSFVGQRIPEIWANPGAGYIWTNPAKVLALAGGAWWLARTGAAAGRFAAGLLGFFLLICGAQHFVY